ncbi:MAG: peptigoglycan-binding protein LysM [Bryobacteraceae bacterium]
MALEKAVLKNTVTGESVQVMFNPEDYTLSRDMNYAQAAVPGLSAPITQFVNGNVPTLEMELFLDTFEKHDASGRVLNSAGQDVRELTRKVTDLMEINSDTHAPPVLIFAWGSLTFTCVLARVTQKFVMFLPSGTPVRARLQVTFNGFQNSDTESREVKRQTADYTKMYGVGQGETISGIAGKVYGNPQTWRPIAIHNGVEHPDSVPVGTRLVIPQLPYQDPENGEVIE